MAPCTQPRRRPGLTCSKVWGGQRADGAFQRGLTRERVRDKRKRETGKNPENNVSVRHNDAETVESTGLGRVPPEKPGTETFLPKSPTTTTICGRSAQRCPKPTKFQGVRPAGANREKVRQINWQNRNRNTDYEVHSATRGLSSYISMSSKEERDTIL